MTWHRLWHNRRGRSEDPQTKLLREMRRQARRDAQQQIVVQGTPTRRNRTPRAERWSTDIPVQHPEWSDGNRPRRDGAAPDKAIEAESGVPSKSEDDLVYPDLYLPEGWYLE